MSLEKRKETDKQKNPLYHTKNFKLYLLETGQLLKALQQRSDNIQAVMDNSNGEARVNPS